MSADPRLKVVLCWHMHQPQYRNPGTGVFELPWTYLHATKDYVEMAAHLEAAPKARCVVNFAPTLLEQLEVYAQNIRSALREGTALADPLLAALAGPELPQDPGRRAQLISACQRINDQRVVQRFPSYRRLIEVARILSREEGALAFLSDGYLADLLVWYHLGWLGESVRRQDPRIQRLQEKGSNFTLGDRQALVSVIGELVASVIPRYRHLAERGQVELSMTPYGHPILPLLLDLNSAREAMPDVHLPVLDSYQDGRERARWHVEHGIAVFRRCFGVNPVGCWPAEGGVSAAALGLLAEHGLRWAASGEQVLRNSLAFSEQVRDLPLEQGLHRAYRLPGQRLACFFRDDGLSDLIGFSYSGWHADDAVANLVHHLENIASACAHNPNSVVSIILDGENAWEYYPENAYFFLSALYQRLSSHPRLRMTTFASCLEEGVIPQELERLVSGSWVYGTFSTWIGHRDKNHAWEMLGEAKQVFDRVVGSGLLPASEVAQAQAQLALCEGSDWFWWFGDYNPGDTVKDFDRLFRLHLAQLYKLLGQPPPGYLAYAFSHGGGAQETGGVMRRGKENA